MQSSMIGGYGGMPNADQMAAKRDAMFAKMDADKNGGLSIEEASEGRGGDMEAKLFTKIDSDGDGNMTLNELEAFQGSSSGGRPEGVGGPPPWVTGGGGGGRPEGVGGPPSLATGASAAKADAQSLFMSMLEEADTESSSVETSEHIADIIAEYEQSMTLLETA